jgi:nucleoside-diphosphate-sugar epimerase
MKVLLTGGSGFIGSHVLAALQAQGLEVVTVGRTHPSTSSNHIEVDMLIVREFEALMRKVSATHLLHLAWETEHGTYWTSPLNLRWVDATIRLVEAFCAAGGQQVVVAGTCAEYDWAHGYCREESTPLKPATLYGTAKDATRRLVAVICDQHQVPCTWGRLFLPYGHGEPLSRLIPSLISVFRGQHPPFAVNLGVYRDFLHVSDVAEGFVSLLGSKSSDQYNICSGQPVRLSEVATSLASLLDADPEPVLALASERPSDPPLLFGENLKLKSTGWQPAFSLAQGLKKALSNSHAPIR